jgi:hypothetical protein
MTFWRIKDGKEYFCTWLEWPTDKRDADDFKHRTIAVAVLRGLRRAGYASKIARLIKVTVKA